jgi:hypothetical protein
MFAGLNVDAMVRSSLPHGGSFPYGFDSSLYRHKTYSHVFLARLA